MTETTACQPGLPAQPGPGIYAEIDRLAQRIEPEMTGWRHHLHQHPELPGREKETAAYITAHLDSLSLDEVRAGIAGHGIVGVLRGGLPGERVMALRADVDALPVKEDSGAGFASTVIDEAYPGGPFPVAHACGHDCHAAMLMGAASVLSELRDRLPGTVLFIFQPAEEGPPLGEKGGAAEMIAQGACADPRPTMVYGHHVCPLPSGYAGYRAGNQFAASCLVKIVITGKQAHGSTPWQGTDPMPAAAAVIGATGQMYRQLNAFRPVTITIGHVEDAGRFNIIGQDVTLLGTVRCEAEEDMKRIQEIISRTVTGIAQAFGCTGQTTFAQDVPPVRNTQEWVDAALPALDRVVGRDKVVLTPATLGYDDVSEFVNRYGGLYLMLGCQDLEFRDGELVPVPGGKGLAVNHNPAFYANDEVLITGTRIHANMTVDHLYGTIAPA